MQINVINISNNQLPQYETPQSAGLDVRYYVYITNASNYNSLHEFDTLYDAERFCEDASYHNSCYIIEGSPKRLYRKGNNHR